MALAVQHALLEGTEPSTLNSRYSRLATSAERLATGLWVNFSADDCTEFSMKELMRTDIASLQRNLEELRNPVSFVRVVDHQAKDISRLFPIHSQKKKKTEAFSLLDTLLIDSEFKKKDKAINDMVAEAKLYQPKISAKSAVLYEYPNIDYRFNTLLDYTGKAKIIGESYAINKLTFLGDDSTFTFKSGRLTNSNSYYPNVHVVSENYDESDGNHFYSVVINFDNTESHDFELAVSFDSPDFHVSGFQLHYHRELGESAMKIHFKTESSVAPQK